MKLAIFSRFRTHQGVCVSPCKATCLSPCCCATCLMFNALPERMNASCLLYARAAQRQFLPVHRLRVSLRLVLAAPAKPYQTARLAHSITSSRSCVEILLPHFSTSEMCTRVHASSLSCPFAGRMAECASVLSGTNYPHRLSGSFHCVTANVIVGCTGARAVQLRRLVRRV